MFLDNFINTLLRPFRELYSQWMRVRNIKGGIQGDIRRVQIIGNQAKGWGNYAAGVAQNPVQGVKQGLGMGGFQQQYAQQPAPAQMMQQVPAGKQKMSWFPWGKKTCPGCQNKLRKSWDRCPFCGLAQGGAGAGPPGMQQPGMQQGMQPGMQQQGMPPGQQQGMPPGMQQPGMPPGYGPPQGYPPGFAPPGYPDPMGMPVMGMGAAPGKTIALSPEQVQAPMLHAGQDGENVAWLVPLEGPQTGELLQLKGKASFGSGEGVTHRILDAAISSRHAEITVDGQNRFRITDFGSTNGTYVNDKKVASTDLVDGDNIRLGRTTFRFKTKH